MFFFRSYPNLSVIISCLFWGTYWIPLRFIDKNNNGSIWPFCISFLIISIFLIKPLFRSFNIIVINKNYHFFIGCFFAALAISLYSESLLRGEIAKVVVLFYLCPIWGTILARIILHQPLTIKRIFSILLGLIGLEIIIGIEKGIFFPTNTVEWIAILAGLTWAISTIFFHLGDSTKGIEKTSLTAFIIPFLFFLISFIPGGRNIELTTSLLTIHSIYLWIILFALIWLIPSILLIFLSVEVLDPGRINILLALEVVVGILSAGLLTNEIISYREYIGAILVVSACSIEVCTKKKINAYFSKLFY
mgnify:CR=1 FL=1|tara:strand:+ start:1026 stop:1940 length:915 start_codon:yes stop_codon:yes gene_type:complete